MRCEAKTAGKQLFRPYCLHIALCSYPAKASSASKSERSRNLEMDYLDLAYQRGDDTPAINGMSMDDTKAAAYVTG